MSPPKKPRPGRKRQAPGPTAPSRRAARPSNGDARHATPPLRPPAAGATLGADHERGGGLFSRALAIARSTPDVRPDVVERYRRLIGEGRYAPDPEEVAERLIREGLEDALEK